MRRHPLIFLAALMLVAATATGSANAGERIGIVLLHGGGSDGSQFNAMRPVIAKAGYGLETPNMCWSNGRRYDKSAEDCMEDVDKAIAKLEAQGFHRIVVAGHSLGGINAILYAAHHKGLAGLIVFAPSGPPQGDDRNPNVAIARQLVRSGKGDEKTTFYGGLNDFTATARAYLSYVGKESPLYDDELLPLISTPILWIAGTLDPGQRTADERFKAAPANPMNSLVSVVADHFETPDVAVGEMIRWLDRLSASLGD